MISRFEAFVATLLLVTVAFGPTKHAKRREKFQSKIDGILFITFLVDFLSCTSCVSWAKGV
jgi:hypothetical protein